MGRSGISAAMPISPKPAIVAASVAGLCVVGAPAASAHAAPAVKTKGPGDSCLIGTFRVQSTHIPFTIKGKKVTLSGGAGIEEHISAAGTDRTVFTGSKPFLATYRKHQLKVTLTGSGTASIHSNSAHTTVTSGRLHSAAGIKIDASYDGNTDKSVERHSAGGTEHFSCTATKLVETSGKVKTVEVRLSRKP